MDKTLNLLEKGYKMVVLGMFMLGCTIAVVIGMIFDMAKQKAYWEGRRAGYARAIADKSNFASK